MSEVIRGETLSLIVKPYEVSRRDINGHKQTVDRQKELFCQKRLEMNEWMRDSNQLQFSIF